MSGDAVARPRQRYATVARVILVFVVVLDSFMLSSLSLSPADWQDWWALVTLSTVLAGNVFVFLVIDRAASAAFVVQCIVGAYGAFVATRILWNVATIPSNGMAPALTISFLLAGAFAVGQILVAALLWRMRRPPSAP